MTLAQQIVRFEIEHDDPCSASRLQAGFPKGEGQGPSMKCQQSLLCGEAADVVCELFVGRQIRRHLHIEVYQLKLSVLWHTTNVCNEMRRQQPKPSAQLPTDVTVDDAWPWQHPMLNLPKMSTQIKPQRKKSSVEGQFGVWAWG